MIVVVVIMVLLFVVDNFSSGRWLFLWVSLLVGDMVGVLVVASHNLGSFFVMLIVVTRVAKFYVFPAVLSCENCYWKNDRLL